MYTCLPFLPAFSQPKAPISICLSVYLVVSVHKFQHQSALFLFFISLLSLFLFFSLLQTLTTLFPLSVFLSLLSTLVFYIPLAVSAVLSPSLVTLSSSVCVSLRSSLSLHTLLSLSVCLSLCLSLSLNPCLSNDLLLLPTFSASFFNLFSPYSFRTLFPNPLPSPRLPLHLPRDDLLFFLPFHSLYLLASHRDRFSSNVVLNEESDDNKASPNSRPIPFRSRLARAQTAADDL